MSHYIPTAPQVIREAICVCAGALLAVAVVRLMPPSVQQFFLLQKVSKQ